MTAEPKKRPPLTPALALSMMALAIAVVALITTSSSNNNQTSELEKKIDQLQINMTQFSNFTQAQSKFNIQVINWASQTEQKIEFIANETAKLQK